jgi:prepilin-type N-terminal cleavage/methylation domain-containing protein
MLKETKMLTKSKKTAGQPGFTLVELLTVMAIIALLIGLMVPALGHVKTTAKIIQQKAQLKSIDTALEAFSASYGDYPPSSESYLDQDATALTTAGPGTLNITCGAQKLAEALVGADLRGFDPRAATYTSGGVTKTANFDRKAIEGDKSVYAVDTINSAVQADVDASLARRKGPYVTVNENVNSFEVADIYSSGNSNYANSRVYPGGEPGRGGTAGTAGAASKKFGNVFCDNFKVKSITYKSYDVSANLLNEVTTKVGTPILYFKADSSRKTLSAKNTVGAESPEDSIFNYNDNMWLVALGKITDGKAHYWADTTNPANSGAPAGDRSAWAFYSYIQNPKISTGRWPYNSDSYLLISAGPDGIYGNADDITNFGSRDAK